MDSIIGSIIVGIIAGIIDTLPMILKKMDIALLYFSKTG